MIANERASLSNWNSLVAAVACLCLSLNTTTARAGAAPTDETVITISPHGSDSTPLDPSAAAIGPLASWARAIVAVNAVAAQRGGKGVIIVDVAPGTYHLSAPVTLSGSKLGGVKVQIRGSGTEWTHISGAQPVEARANVGASVALSPDTLHAFRTIRYGSTFGVADQPILLWRGDERVTPGRWPKAGWGQIKSAALTGTVWRIVLSDPNGQPVRLKPDAVRLSGFFGRDWQYDSVPAQLIAPDVIEAPAAEFRYGARPGARIILEGATGGDVDTQAHIDRVNEALVLSAPGAYELSRTRNFLLVEDTAGISITGLDLSGFAGDAVIVRSSHDVEISNDNFSRIGGRAIWIAGSSEVRVHGDSFRLIGQGGVDAEGGDRVTLRPSDIEVSDNTFERFAELALTYRPAIRILGVGGLVTGNVIHDGPHSAIIFEGNNHRITGNTIYSVALECSDCGAIYSWRDWTTYGNVIEDNYLYDIKPHAPMPTDLHSRSAQTTKGIYLDDLVSGVTIRNNIFYNVDYAVFLNAGNDLTVQNNIFINSNPSLLFNPWGTYGVRADTGNEYRAVQILHDLKARGSVLFHRYPRLNETVNDLRQPQGNVWGGNILVNSAPPAFRLNGAALLRRTEDSVIHPPPGLIPDPAHEAAPRQAVRAAVQRLLATGSFR